MVQPDGVIQTTRAGRQWTALVEVKTSDSCLQREQIETYLDVAREANFDAVLTISNQIESAPGEHPVEVDRRKLKRVAIDRNAKRVGLGRTEYLRRTLA
jgi:hypothetical protein